MPQALWLIALPLGIAPLVYFLRRKILGAFLAILIAFATTWLAMQLPTGVVLRLLGRTIELGPLSQVSLSLLFAATAVLFLALALYREETGVALPGKAVNQEARIFYPSALIILSLFVAASLSRHLGITAIFIELAAILAVFVIQTERLESTRAALRFLILFSLAMPFLLLAARQIDIYQLNGGLISSTQLEQTALFVGVGFAMWLAIVPFHGWLTSTATEASPPMAAFVLITFPVVAFSAFIHLLIDSPWLVDSLYLMNALVLAGVFTAFIGGAMASVQRGFSELLGYAATFNLGCMVVILGLGGRSAVITILVALAVRSLALALIGVSVFAIQIHVINDGFTQVRGVAQRLPVAITGLMVGGLTLAGMPLTAGFAPYWQLLRSIAQVDGRWLVLLVLGGLGVAIGYLRGLRATLLDEPNGASGNASLKFQEPFPLLVIIAVLTSACILVGLFPSLLIEPLQTALLSVNLPTP